MTIFLIDDRPHVAVSNGFKAIPTLLYLALVERGEITEIITVETD